MAPTTFLQWFLRLLLHFIRPTPKQLRHESAPSSMFSCDTCREPLDTIHRFDDRSYCKSCHADLDSEDSEGSAFSD